MCFQAHRHWQILWNLDQTWNQEKMNKSSHPARKTIESRVIPLPAKWETWSHPKINKADVVLATHTTDTSWQDDVSWWPFQRCHWNWVSQPRYRHKPFGGLSWGGRYEGVPPVNNQASSNFVVSQDTDVAVLRYCWYILTNEMSENLDKKIACPYSHHRESDIERD